MCATLSDPTREYGGKGCWCGGRALVSHFCDENQALLELLYTRRHTRYSAYNWDRSILEADVL